MKGKNGASKDGAMKAKKGAAAGLRELFIDELKDIYWAEKALVKAMPKMAKNASSNELVQALEQHLKETENQVERLEKVFEAIGEKATGKKCEAMEGLIAEAEELMKSTEEGMVRDAAIISAAQKVEHYEIASYGTLCSMAKTLNEDEAAKLLYETLEEEKSTDEILTKVSETVNEEALVEEE